MTSLVEFAEKTRPRCFICEIPERQEIDLAYKAGKVKPAQVRKWLIEEVGYQEVPHNFKNHFQEHCK